MQESLIKQNELSRFEFDIDGEAFVNVFGIGHLKKSHIGSGFNMGQQLSVGARNNLQAGVVPGHTVDRQPCRNNDRRL